MMQQRLAGARPAVAARRPACVRALPPRAAPQQPVRAAPAAAPRLPARLSVRASASGAAAPLPAQPAKAAPQVGVKLVPAAISIAVGLIVNYLIPAPAGITAKAWQLFAIFISTICGARAEEGTPAGARSGSRLRFARLVQPACMHGAKV